MQVLRLSASDARLLAARFTEHGNSHQRMCAALKDAGTRAVPARLRALRALERRFDVDLGSICFRFQRRDDPGVHPIERLVVQYITRPARGAHPDAADVWILLDHVRRVRELKEGRLVGEPDR